MRRQWFSLWALLLVIGTSAAGVGHADTGGLQVSNVDVGSSPHVAIDFTAPAMVTGRALTHADVSVRENGKPIEATLTVVPTTGVEVVLVIDTSGSMKEGDAMRAAKLAANRFLQVLPAEVAVGVVTFADAPRLVSALTRDRVLLSRSIGSLSAGGETSLYDGMVLARSLFSGATTDRQIVLLSDGGNTVGSSNAADALAVARSIRTSVVELSSSEANHSALLQLATANHGNITAVGLPAALTGLYETIAKSLVHRYRLAFDSAATGAVTYTVTVRTPTTPLSTTVTASIPVHSVVTSTTEPSSTAPSTTAVAAAVPADTPTSSGRSADTWLLIGATLMFVALLIAALMFIRRPGRSDAAPLVTVARPVAVAADERTGIGRWLESMADRALSRG
ncbi:MAG: vWA domain-containing protein, partial [Actinomycetota bacterium]